MPVRDLQAALLALLDETAQLLRRFKVDHFADWLEADRERLARGDTYALKHLLSAFGGMGSLNDVVLYSGEPHLATAGTYDAEANERLSECRGRLWGIARELQRELT